MPRRSTTRIRKTYQHKLLQARVATPRIRAWEAWRGVKSALKLFTFCCLLAAAAYGIKLGFDELFIRNPDYKLKEVIVHTNGKLTKDWVIKVGQFDPNGSVVLMQCNEIEKRLKARPELVDAKVTSQLPDAIRIDLIERIPTAWLACPAKNLVAPDPDGGLLVDANGNLFRCEGQILDASQSLPVIEVHERDQLHGEPLEPGAKIQHLITKSSLHLIRLSQEKHLSELPKILKVSSPNPFSLVAEFEDGTNATFGHYDQPRQLNDLLTFWKNAKETKREIVEVNLILKRNTPIRYRPAKARRAIIVEPARHPIPVSPSSP